MPCMRFCSSDQMFAASFLQILRQAKRQVDYHLTMDTLALGYAILAIRARSGLAPGS